MRNDDSRTMSDVANPHLRRVVAKSGNDVFVAEIRPRDPADTAALKDFTAQEDEAFRKAAIAELRRIYGMG